MLPCAHKEPFLLWTWWGKTWVTVGAQTQLSLSSLPPSRAAHGWKVDEALITFPSATLNPTPLWTRPSCCFLARFLLVLLKPPFQSDSLMSYMMGTHCLQYIVRTHERYEKRLLRGKGLGEPLRPKEVDSAWQLRPPNYTWALEASSAFCCLIC